jgi:uncharacterized protein YndB with AHSA1/START domain
MELPGFDLQDLFDHWVEAALLRRWWPPQAEVEPCKGGAYHLSWPAMDWHLRGVITRYEPCRALEFTWRWDHDPERPETRVLVSFERASSAGSTLSLRHGPYPASDMGGEMRQEHLEGWLHFLPRLADLRAGAG